MFRDRLVTALRHACAHPRTPAYGGAPATRPVDARLEDAAWVANARQEASQVMLLDLSKNAAAVTASGSIAWVSTEHAAELGAVDDDTVLLGRRKADALPKSFLNERYARVAQNQWCFASTIDSAEQASTSGNAIAGFAGLRELVATAPAADASLAGQARNLLLWHRNHRWCGRCGGVNLSAKAGWKRVCTACGAAHFPRTDPVIISAVLNPAGTKCLLGRQATWPPGRFSCLAGFVDPGETLEEAVCREVREEASVRLARDSITYHASQPWPNGPAGQLMLGFVAVAESEALSVDDDELETAQWVDVAEVRAALAGSVAQASGGGTGYGQGSHVGGLMLPAPSAIANVLLSTACEAARRAHEQGG